MAALALAAGCDRTQPWRFTNGASLGDAQPASIVAEVFEGDCGPCEPDGARRYCDVLAMGGTGAAPRDLVDGQTYCFVGTALDEAGTAYGVGCASARVGAGAIEVTLAAIEPDRFVARQCGPRIDLDAGAFDAGDLDAGAGGSDAGLPVGTPVRVLYVPEGAGTVVFRDASGTPLIAQAFRQPMRFQLDAYVGFVMQIDPMPDPGATYLGADGACGTEDPCQVRLDRTEEIHIRFSP
ncbi:MAG: hypothetical protein AB7S26_38260 [Sandaracinaceae bacterium]